MESDGAYAEEKKLGIGTIFQYLGSSSTLVAGALFYVFMVKTIPQDSVGAVTLFQSVLGLFVTLFAFGMSYAGQHFISYFIGRNDSASARSTIKTIGTMILILSTATAFSIYFFSDFFARYFLNLSSVQEQDAFFHLSRMLFYVGGIFLANNLMNGMLLGLQKYRQSGIATMSAAVFNYGFPFVLLIIYSFGLPGAGLIRGFSNLLTGGIDNEMSVSSGIVIAGWMFGYTVSFLIYVTLLFRGMRSAFSGEKARVQIQPAFVRRMMRYSLPMFLSSLVTFGALQTDRLTVAHFLPLSELAVYNLGLLIATSVAFFINPINSILLPKISQYFAQRNQVNIRRGIGMTMDIVTFIYVPIALFIVSISGGVIIVLGNASYIGASLPFSIILTVSAVFITQNVLAQALAGIGATKTFLFSSTSTLASNIILSIILIPRYGLTGAAVAYSSVYVVNFTVLYIFAKKFGITEHRISRIVKIWISSAVMCAAVYLFGTYVFTISFNVPPGILSFIAHDILRLVVYLILGLFVYVGMIRLTGSIATEEIEFFFRFMPRWLQFSKKFLLVLFSNRNSGSGAA